MELIVTAVLAAIVVLILYLWTLSGVDYWKKRGIPHVKSLPLFGNTLNTVLMRRTFVQNVTDIYKRLDGEKFGGYMQFAKPVLLIRDPEIISQVLIKDFTHFHDRGFPMDEELEPLSASLANLTGDRWRHVRHKLTPTFTSGKLKIMFDQIIECSDDAIKVLKNEKEAIEVKQFMQKFNLNVIGMVAFGLKVDAFNKNEASNTFVKHATKFFSPSMRTLMLFMLRMSFPDLAKRLKVRLLEPEMSDFFINLVQDTIEHRGKTNTRRNDFIQLMLDLKEQEASKMAHHPDSVHTLKNQSTHKDEHDVEDKELLDQLDNTPLHNELQTQVFTDNCIAAQSFLFISGGSETTASVLSFALYEIAANPEVQDKLQNEIDSVLSSQEFDYSATKEMTYMEQFLNEVLRLHSPGGVLARICTEDFVLPGTNKVIEKGVLINVPVQALHKDPKYFPDPETFNPDRFKDMKAIPKGVFFPFGGGPRICIAMRLAMLEMKIFLARLVSKYNLSLSEKTQLPLKIAPNSIVLSVVGGIWVKFEERE